MLLVTFRHSTSCAVHCMTYVQEKDHPATQCTVPHHFSMYGKASKELLGNYPPYSPDLAASDNHLFQFSKNWMQASTMQPMRQSVLRELLKKSSI